MDNKPNPNPFNPTSSSPLSPVGNTAQGPTSNPYETEIPTESIEHTPEQPRSYDNQTPFEQRQAPTSPLTPTTPSSTPPTADEARSNDLPHKPHHFMTKKALILGVLFIITAGLSSIVTFSLVSSQSKKIPATTNQIAPTPTIEQAKEFTSKKTGLSFSYPAGWTASESASDDTISKITITKQDAPTIELFLGPAGVGGQCINDPLVELGSEPITAFGKPLNIFFQGDSMTQKFTGAYVVAGVSPCPNIAFIDISDLTTSQSDPVSISLASITLSDPSGPLLPDFTASKGYAEAKGIIQSLAIKPLNDQSSSTPSDSMTACTMEARVCPDGSSVGRVPPSCEFAACP